MGDFDPQKWEELASNYDEDYEKSGGDWTPEAGWRGAVKMVRLERFEFTDQKSGSQMPMWKPVVSIMDGEFEGEEFPLGLFTPKNFWLLRVVVSKIAGGEVITTRAAAEAVLAEGVEEERILNVHVETNKGGYDNVVVDGVVAVEG